MYGSQLRPTINGVICLESARPREAVALNIESASVEGEERENTAIREGSVVARSPS